MTRIIILMIVVNSSLFSMEKNGFQKYPRIVFSEKQRSWGYSRHFAEFLAVFFSKAIIAGVCLYGILRVTKTRFSFLYERCKEKTKKYMFLRFTISGNLVHKKELLVPVFLSYSFSTIALYLLYKYVKNIYERHCLTLLQAQIAMMYKKFDKEGHESLFLGYLTHCIHNPFFPPCFKHEELPADESQGIYSRCRDTKSWIKYEERKWFFTRDLNEDIVAKTCVPKDPYDIVYTYGLLSRRYGEEAVRHVIEAQGEGNSFCIDFEEKDYDLLEEQGKRHSKFSSFFTFVLLHIPLLKRFFPEKHAYPLNQKIDFPAATSEKGFSAKSFSLFFIKKHREATYPFLLVTYQRDGKISSIVPYFCHRIGSVLRQSLTHPYYAIRTRAYFLKDNAEHNSEQIVLEPVINQEIELKESKEKKPQGVNQPQGKKKKRRKRKRGSKKHKYA